MRVYNSWLVLHAQHTMSTVTTHSLSIIAANKRLNRTLTLIATNPYICAVDLNYVHVLTNVFSVVYRSLAAKCCCREPLRRPTTPIVGFSLGTGTD